MMELIHYRPDYVVAGNGSSEHRLADAHRTLRTAMAVGEVLRVAADVHERAARVIEMTEGAPDGERRFMPQEAAALAALAAFAAEVATELDRAVDNDHRRRGEGGARVLREAVDFNDLIGK